MSGKPPAAYPCCVSALGEFCGGDSRSSSGWIRTNDVLVMSEADWATSLQSQVSTTCGGIRGKIRTSYRSADRGLLPSVRCFCSA